MKSQKEIELSLKIKDAKIKAIAHQESLKAELKEVKNIQQLNENDEKKTHDLMIKASLSDVVIMSEKLFKTTKVNIRGNVVEGKGTIGRVEAINNAYLEYTQLCDKEKVKSKSLLLFQIAAEQVLKRKINNILVDLRDQFKCEGVEDESELSKFCDIVWPKGYTDYEFYSLKHSIYQVKRKIMNKPVHNHTCLVLFGKQGMGKSMALKSLFTPLKEYVFGLHVNQLNDPQKIGIKMSQSYIGMLDEMAHCGKTSSEALKSIITTPTVDVRLFRTQDVVPYEQNCTFFGTSNIKLEFLLKDNENRRFIELILQDFVNISDLLNNIDYMKLWKGIDENLEEPYLRIKKEVQKKQEEMSTQDIYEEFAEEQMLIPESGAKTTTIDKKELFQHFVAWCNVRKYNPFKYNGFCKKVTAFSIKQQSKRVDGVRQRVFCISKDYIRTETYSQFGDMT